MNFLKGKKKWQISKIFQYGTDKINSERRMYLFFLERQKNSSQITPPQKKPPNRTEIKERREEKNWTYLRNKNKFQKNSTISKV